MIDLMVDLLPDGDIPFASEQVNLPDGLYYASYAYVSHKATLFPALAVGPSAMASMLATAITRYSLSAATAEVAPPNNEADTATEEARDAVADIPSVAVDNDPRAPGPTVRYRIPLGGPSRGATQPTVAIVEFADFQCPFCARVSPTLQQLLEKYPNDVRLYFRHNPLPFHNEAALAAQAAMAAQAQNKFWPMYDVLFANQQHLSRTDLEAYATTTGLDIARFNRELDRGTYRKAVADDAALAAKVGAMGTPNFFINGLPLSGAQPLERFTAIIDEEIAKARELMAAGTKRRDLYTKLMATATAPKP